MSVFVCNRTNSNLCLFIANKTFWRHLDELRICNGLVFRFQMSAAKNSKNVILNDLFVDVRQELKVKKFF